MSINEIENAIAKLSRQNLAAFRAWFYKFDARTWDKQFEEDVKLGNLDDIANKAIEDFKNDRCKEL